MIRLIPKYRVHIPNKLAVFAAVILALTSYTGLSRQDSGNPELATGTQVETSVAVDRKANTNKIAPKKRKLNISALLFGNG